jgi:hypothetical protein
MQEATHPYRQEEWYRRLTLNQLEIFLISVLSNMLDKNRLNSLQIGDEIAVCHFGAMRTIDTSIWTLTQRIPTGMILSKGEKTMEMDLNGVQVNQIFPDFIK